MVVVDVVPHIDVTVAKARKPVTIFIAGYCQAGPGTRAVWAVTYDELKTGRAAVSESESSY